MAFRNMCIRLYLGTQEKIANVRGEFGVGSILSIAVALIVSAFVLVPGMRTFADTIIKGMSAWWDGTIRGNIFPTA
jgi:hypothetical protein